MLKTHWHLAETLPLMELEGLRKLKGFWCCSLVPPKIILHKTTTGPAAPRPPPPPNPHLSSASRRSLLALKVAFCSFTLITLFPCQRPLACDLVRSELSKTWKLKFWFRLSHSQHCDFGWGLSFLILGNGRFRFTKTQQPWSGRLWALASLKLSHFVHHQPCEKGTVSLSLQRGMWRLRELEQLS